MSKRIANMPKHFGKVASANGNAGDAKGFEIGSRRSATGGPLWRNESRAWQRQRSPHWPIYRTRLNAQQLPHWALRGRLDESSGEYEQALADFDRSLEFDHDDRQLLLETAELYRRLNRPQRALATLPVSAKPMALTKSRKTSSI